MGADPDHEGDETFDVYLRAKGRADADLAESGLDYTIVRPGGLTDDPPTGQGLRLRERRARPDPASRRRRRAGRGARRAPNSIGKTFELISGETPIEDAVAAV